MRCFQGCGMRFIGLTALLQRHIDLPGYRLRVQLIKVSVGGAQRTPNG